MATGTTTAVHTFSPGDFVLISGAGGYDGTYQLAATAGTTFTFTGPGGVGPVVGGTVTLLSSIPNLVSGFGVANLDSAANFTRPYRLAFPVGMQTTPFTFTLNGG